MNTTPSFGGGLVWSICSKAAISFSHLVKLCWLSAQKTGQAKLRSRSAVEKKRIEGRFMARTHKADKTAPQTNFMRNYSFLIRFLIAMLCLGD